MKVFVLLPESNWIQKAVPDSREGIFTAKAKKAGMSVQAYARKVLSDPNASTKTKRQAAFAKRAGKGF